MNRRQKLLVIALAAVIVASGLSVGLVQAYAQDEATLSPMTPAELLTRVVDRGSTPVAVRGDITISNKVLGSFPAEMSQAGGSGPAAFLQGGEGRIWIQGDKARIDAQGAFNDTVLYYDGENVTIYDSSANSLTVYSLPSTLAGETAVPDEQDHHVALDPQTAIPEMIERLAPAAQLTVSGLERVAGRDCYMLTLIPTAPNTIFGSLSVAIDGQTYLPLQVAVYAKGGTEPVFLAGFTSISYDPIDNAVFEVPSPPGADVEQKQLEWPFDRPIEETGTAGIDAAEKAENLRTALEPLTVEEASAKAGFPVLAAQTNDPDYAFQGAYVLDLPEEALPIDSADSPAGGDGDEGGTAGGFSGGLAAEEGIGLADMIEGPVVVQVYGQGFGTVVMVQAKSGPISSEAFQSLQTQVPFLQTADLGGTPALQFATSLASLLGWQQDGVTLLAGGSVPAADLNALAASVR